MPFPRTPEERAASTPTGLSEEGFSGLRGSGDQPQVESVPLPAQTATLLSQVLEAAAALVEPPLAWGRELYAAHEPGAPNGTCYCVLGAIAKAAGIRTWDADEAPATRFFLRAIGAGTKPHRFDVVSSWNDAPERTQAEVVAALRAAAALAKAEGA